MGNTEVDNYLSDQILYFDLSYRLTRREEYHYFIPYYTREFSLDEVAALGKEIYSQTNGQVDIAWIDMCEEEVDILVKYYGEWNFKTKDLFRPGSKVTM